MSIPIHGRLSYLRYGNGSATAAERIEHNISFLAAGADDAFKQGFRFLGGIA